MKIFREFNRKKLEHVDGPMDLKTKWSFGLAILALGVVGFLFVVIPRLINHKTQNDNSFHNPNNKTQNNNSLYNLNGPYPSPLVDNINMINARGEVVDKWINGTFKITGENKTFKYRERISPYYYRSVIDNCVKLNCKKIYFIDETYIEVGPANIYTQFNDTDNPAIGKIVKIDFYSKGGKVASYSNPHDISDSATYTIIYSQNGKPGQTITYSEDLCHVNKGGGQSCYEPHYKVGAVVIFLNKENKSSLIASSDANNVSFTGKLIEAQLISYQYSMIPDTGEVFPIIQR